MNLERLVSSLSIEEKVGQVLTIGIPSSELDSTTRMMIREFRPGGVILYRRNIEGPDQLRALIKDLQAAATRSGAGIGLLVAIDQEGGTAIQLWESEVPVPPGAHAIAAASSEDARGREELAHQVAFASGRDIKTFGVNMNLAPVLDVNSNPENPVIGVRSFGADPCLVATLGAAMARGFKDAGILCCGKHFPGHGDTRLDSHLDLPVVPHDRQRLDAVELVPFRHAIAAGIDAIMAAHVAFPAIERDLEVPATLSAAVVSGLLKGELEFPGVALSDLMSMKAIADRYEAGEAAVRAVAAGIDVLLTADDQRLQRVTRDALLSALASGRLNAARLDDAVRRILSLKLRAGLVPLSSGQPGIGYAARTREPGKPAESRGTAEVEAHSQLFAEVHRKAITVVRDMNGALPLRVPEASLVGVVFIAHEDELHQQRWKSAREVLLGEFRRRHPLCVEMTARSADLESVKARTEALVIVFCTRRDLTPEEVDMARSLASSGKPVIGLGLFNPFIIRRVPEMSCFLAAYDYSSEAVKAAVGAVFGEFEAKGVFPAEIGANWR